MIVLKKIITIFQHPHKHRWPKLQPIFSNGFGPNGAAEEVVFFCRELPGREDEKQSTWCLLGMAWTTVRDSKWHIHRSMYECISQLAPRDLLWNHILSLSESLCRHVWYVLLYFTPFHLNQLGFLCHQTHNSNHSCIRVLPPVWFDSTYKQKKKSNNTFQHFFWWLKGNTTINVQSMIMSLFHRWSWATWECQLCTYDNFPKVCLLHSGPCLNQILCNNNAMVGVPPSDLLLFVSIQKITNHVSVALFGFRNSRFFFSNIFFLRLSKYHRYFCPQWCIACSLGSTVHHCLKCPYVKRERLCGEEWIVCVLLL